MDFEKLLEIAEQHLSRYSRDFVATLSGAGAAELAAKSKSSLKSSLWVFVLLSILIGSTLGALAHLPKGADIQVVTVFLLVNWFAFSAWAFFVSRVLLQGPAKFPESSHALLRVLAVTYVTSNFTAIFGALFPPTTVNGKQVYLVPAVIYFVTQAALLSIYITLNLRKLNTFSGLRVAALGTLVPIPLLLFNAVVFFGAWFAADLNLEGIFAK